MPAKKQISKKAILQAALDIVRKSGVKTINARILAQKLKCSTQPIYLSFKGMDELKVAVTQAIDNEYDTFVKKHIDIDNYMISKSKAHILFALYEKNLYKAMFLSNTLEGISIDDIASAEWNQKAISSIMSDFNIDKSSAQKVFINLWLFSSGLAIELATNDMNISESDIDSLLTEFYERMKICYA
ncbi:TetR/AcrR family transcriptional regulator [Clostridium sp. D2Q-14]|uniref:TetR/AcrR family transcriptional regulator n=1 Tax=Anaeromonas gelatinilytica TaxID=2683194 RepID=UPI00193B6F38|nr:TetR/AcrR family transcriptional regulator [Anaeromonas gelatinilytica]MBS4534598.1 TetR/AcrR family transcriptional regulator [Anaeromonas gelatinilytica]